MAKYVKALDYMSCAVQAYRQGRFEQAATLLKAAAQHPSRVQASKLIDDFNNRAIAAAKKSKGKKRKAKAAAWPFTVRSNSEPLPADDNQEYGIEPDQNNMREVQEADDLEGDGLGLDDTAEDLDEDLEEALAQLDETLDDEGGETANDDEGEGDAEDEPEAVEQARFIRALRNSRAQRASATSSKRVKAGRRI